MPTYRNNRSSALYLSVPSGAPERPVNSGETFTAHPSEVPVGWLDLGIVTKVSDSPDVPEPRKPSTVEPPGGAARTIEQFREELKAENLKTELLIEQMRKENATLVSEAVKAATAAQQLPAPAAGTTDAPSPAKLKAADKAAEKPAEKAADKDEKKS